MGQQMRARRLKKGIKEVPRRDGNLRGARAPMKQVNGQGGNSWQGCQCQLLTMGIFTLKWFQEERQDG